jgi:hypothetical protein
MMSNELERLEQLKKEAIENPGKKVKGCRECKKKKEITVTSPELIIEENIPTKEQMIEAYQLMYANANSEKDLKKIGFVFNYVMGYDIKSKCRGCGNSEFIKFQHKLRNTFKLDI